MALAQVLKVFTKERLFYQHLNAQNQHFVDRINERLESSEVSATKAANKVPRANASGQLEYDLKGNVTGNVTGNADTATLAQAAKGDTRFWISGCVGGSASLDLAGGASSHRQQIYRSVPEGKTLKLKKASYYLCGSMPYASYLRLQIFFNNTLKWTSSLYREDVNLDIAIDAVSGDLVIQIYNSGSATVSVFPYTSWWLEFAIE